MKRVCIYCRTSTGRQEAEETIELQIDECLAAIKANGDILIPNGTYRDEGWTGTILERPELDRLRADARNRLFDAVYVYDRGRLARRFVYQEILIEELQGLDIEFISLHEKPAETDEDRMLQSMQGVFHEYERIKIYERMRGGKFRKVRNGQLLGYNALYGYDYHQRIKGANPQEASFTINEAEAEVVQTIFDWVDQEEIGYREIIRRLQQQGTPPRKQKRDTWTKGPVSRILRNRSYIGEHHYNKSESVAPKNPRLQDQRYRKNKKSSRVERPKDEWLPIQIPAIIEKDVFERVQKILAKNQNKSPRNNKVNDYLLAGLIFCTCGTTRVGSGVKDKLYYRCADRIYRFPEPRVCQEGGVNVQVLDPLVWKELYALLSDLGLIQAQAERWLGNKTAAPSPSIQIKDKLATLKEEEGRYAKAYGLGFMAEDIFHQRMTDVQKRQQKLLEQLAAAPEDSNPLLTWH